MFYGFQSKCIDIQPVKVEFIYMKSYLTKVHFKTIGTFVIFCDNFPNFCPIDVFSLEMESQVYEDNLQLFPAIKKANLDRCHTVIFSF